jgi:hypothetical protein
LWLRAVIGNTAPEFFRPPGVNEALGKNVTGGQMLPPTNSYLTVDAFLDPYRGDVQPVEYRSSRAAIQLLVRGGRATVQS